MALRAYWKGYLRLFPATFAGVWTGVLACWSREARAHRAIFQAAPARGQRS